MKQHITVTQQESGWVLDTGKRLASQSAAPVEVIRQVHAYAVAKKYAFPVELNITTQENKVIPLLLQANGSTTKNPQAFIPPTPPVVETAPNEQNASSVVAEEPPSDSAHVDSPAPNKHKKTLIPLAIGAGALLLLAGCTAYVLTQPKTTEPPQTAQTTTSEPTTEPALYEIPSEENIVSLSGTYLVGSQDTELKVTDVLTGKSVLQESVTIDPDKLRAQSYQGNTLIDGGKGKVLLLRNGKQTALDGVLNTRGTVPVIVSQDFKKYTVIGEDPQEVPKKSSLLGATEKNLLFVKAPAKIEYSKDGRTVSIAPPAEGAKLTAWIAGTENRAVTVWSKDSTTWLIVSDTKAQGKTVLTEEIPNPDAVSYSQGHVIVSEERYLENDQLHNLCKPGKWIEGNRWCEDNGQWTYKDQTLTKEPELITNQYLVTDHKVEER